MYALVRLIARLYVNGWYRVEVVGEPFPGEGPLLVAGNHTNGLMDVGLLFSEAPRPVRFLAKFKLFDTPIIAPLARWGGAIPVYRRKDNVPTELNQSSFEAVFAALRAGEVIGVFPEGESGTSHRLRPPLKTGIARMALGAAASCEGLDVRILPLGIHVHERDRFRSRLELRVGRSFPVRAHLDLFRTDPRAAVLALMTEVEDALREVGPDLRDDEDLALFRLARSAWRAPGGAHHPALAALTEHLAADRARRPGVAAERAAQAEALGRELRRRRLDAGEVIDAQRPTALVRLLLVSITGPAVLAAALVWGLPVALARLAARNLAPGDKFVTVSALVAPLLGTLLVTLIAGAFALTGPGAVTLLAVPAAWILLAVGIRALDTWRRAWAPFRTPDDLRRRLGAVLAAGDPESTSSRSAKTERRA